MKTLTKLLMVLVIGVLIVGVAFRVIGVGGDNGDEKIELLPTPTALPPEPINVSFIAALPVEPWVRSAAKTFNAEDHFVSRRKVEVEVIPQEGLRALGKWAQGAFRTSAYSVACRKQGVG